MSLLRVSFFGDSIGKSMGMNIIHPDGPGPYPVLYLLHGLSDDCTMWQRRTSIERYVSGLPLIVAMPDGGRSFYCNHTGGDQYDDHIVKDVVGYVDRTFKTVASAGGRAIGGLSMGGYGAIMLALRHPDVFSVASSHSGALAIIHWPRPNRPDVEAIVRDVPRPEYDCFTLAEKLAAQGQKPALRFDCGTEDFLLPDNRAFHKHLLKLKIKHQYKEHPGEHNWEYWDEHVREGIAFVMKNLKAKG